MFPLLLQFLYWLAMSMPLITSSTPDSPFLFLPFFEQEKAMVKEHVRFVLDDKGAKPSSSTTEYFSNNGQARDALSRAIGILSSRKDHLLMNDCDEGDIIKYIELKWTMLRLQKLPLAVTRDLTPEQRKKRSSILRMARSAVSRLERKCVTPIIDDRFVAPEPVLPPTGRPLFCFTTFLGKVLMFLC